MKRRTFISTALAASLPLHAQTRPPQVPGADSPVSPQPSETIDLWPGGAPGMPDSPPAETVNERSTDPQLSDRAVYGITNPRMVVFRPAEPNGAAVMVTPGGGYRWVVVDKEGYAIGRWLSARGFTVFVLFYRLPAEGWEAGPNVSLADAQRAIRLIRARSENYGIDPERIATMGFSAGGHVSTDLTARFATRVYDAIDSADTLSARPSAAAHIYPVVSMSLPVAHAGSRKMLIGEDASPALEAAHSPHLHIPDDAPPCFILHAEDDASVAVENSLLLRAVLKSKNIAVETHLFANGGHGFGLRKTAGKPVAVWPELFFSWARTTGIA